MTPMQQQYNEIKSRYPNFILLFRLGDFYEAFDEDAKKISQVLGITLTSRGKGESKRPMAGIPHHALKNYLPKLIEEGLKVAIADQTEEAVPGKLVERKVTKVITPGTVIDDGNDLPHFKNNYLGCVLIDEKIFGFTDPHTGLINIFKANTINQLFSEVLKYNPSEILVKKSEVNKLKDLKNIEILPDDFFNLERATDFIKSHFEINSLKGFGLDQDKGAVIVLGAVLRYLAECHLNGIRHLRKVNVYDYDGVMNLDSETIRNLELIFPLNNDGISLYDVINKCKTPMGKRMLRNWIIQPLNDKNKIQQRLDAVEFFYNNKDILEDLEIKLKEISDIERITARLGVRSANPKDLVALKESLIATFDFFDHLENKNLPKLLQDIKNYFVDSSNYEQIKNIIEYLDKAIINDPAVNINEGRIINDGFDAKVDEFRNLRQNAQKIIREMQQKEIESTGISSLKISFNRVFGYYIEVTKSNLQKVPDNYIRKQTLANAERFITQELKEIEEKLLNAETELIEREKELFFEILDEISKYLEYFLTIANFVANVDIWVAFAKIARERKYTKPNIVQGYCEIVNARHPVVEAISKTFTPNSTKFKSDNLIHIITGPNMSGKSTYIRQVALNFLLAQIGSFVPADKMEFEVVDRIFTRVGASDNLARGESTFMVEMNETANILNNATSQSLIILDEVGRGTSTYDGVAIAWSILEFIAQKIFCKTLFATHYHEVTALENNFSNIKNFSVDVEERDQNIFFKHKIVEGATNKSYGVHVAKLAGVPEEVIRRANEILNDFEKQSKNENRASQI
ncbi:MAG: DNA mismatch repair protein MutS [Candidatus Dojkabacteria bacterium]|nr:MAG: DNA mismatch repair protein MutS [Candidatus Dojkabacteria bacterium]